MIHKNIVWYSIVAIGIIVIDRISKMLVMYYKPCDYSVGPFLHFHYIQNRGISWGLLHSTNTMQYWFITAFIILFLIGFGWYAYKQYTVGKSLLGETFVFAGGIANIVDRFLYGGVVDFIYISYKSFSFPIFNVADCAIVFGAFFLLGQELLNNK